MPCSLPRSSKNAGFSGILASFTPQENNGKARMKISKGNMYSNKATVVYTLQTGMAREPFIINTTQFTLTLPKVKITLANFHPYLAVSSCSVNGV